MTVPSIDQAFGRAAAACARREYCRADWQHKLSATGLEAADVEAVVQRLEAEGYISDERFARAFVHDKTQHDFWGRIKVGLALRSRGVSESVVRQALDEVDMEAYRAGLSQLLERRARTLAAADPHERRLRLMRYAAGRGYEAHEVARILGEDDGFFS